MAATVVQITQAGDADAASGTPLSPKACAQGRREEKGKQQDTHDGGDQKHYKRGGGDSAHWG